MAGTYATPGVYIEEQPSGSMPIQGVSTSIAAFVGFTRSYDASQGDPGDPQGIKPQLVTSWPQYERVYGGFVAGAMLPYAVRGFFENGGGACYIVRASAGGPAHPPELQLAAAAHPEVPSLTVRAIEDDGAQYEVEIVPPVAPAEGQPPAEDFTMNVYRDGDLAEQISGLSFSKSPRQFEKSVNDQATKIRVEVQNVQGVSLADRLPVIGRFALAAPVPQKVDPLVLEGSENERTGYQGLAIADNVTVVAIPDLVTVATRPDGSFDLDTYLAFQGQLADWCAASARRMAILDPPPGLNATNAVEWRQRLAKDTPFAACYYPNIVVPNRSPEAVASGEKMITVPPSGHVAGVWARTDSSRGVWKAPANEEIRGVTGLENLVTDGEQAALNPIGVNCIRSFGSNGMRLWGARTLSLTDSSWRYINVRRLFNYVEESIRRGTQWAVFEPNDRDLWQRVKRNITAFLRGLWMQGALVGATPEQAFYVLCDETNNPPSSVEEGKLIVEIGVCPSRPAEFVIFRISQWQGGEETTE